MKTKVIFLINPYLKLLLLDKGAPKIHKHKQKPTDIHKQLFMYNSN